VADVIIYESYDMISNIKALNQWLDDYHLACIPTYSIDMDVIERMEKEGVDPFEFMELILPVELLSCKDL
jgi:hypothetical protein